MEQKGIIVGMSASGKSIRQIIQIMKAQGVNISVGGVHKILSHQKNNKTTARKKGSGRPRKMTERDCHKLKLNVLKNRKTTMTHIAETFTCSDDKKVSRWTISRRLKDQGFKIHPCKKVPLLTARHKKARLAWVKYNKNTDWTKILWSDESRFCLHSDRPQMCIRRKNEQLNPDCIHQTVKGNLGIMVWGCFSAKGVGRLHRVEDGLRINSKEYISILQKSLLPTLEELEEDEIKFQHDNAPCHTSKQVKKWLKDNNIFLFENWPAQSPDLNPIENLWDYMDKEVHKNNISSLDDLWAAIKQVWVTIPDRLIANLIESMPRRLNEVMKNGGGHTKY